MHLSGLKELRLDEGKKLHFHLNGVSFIPANGGVNNGLYRPIHLEIKVVRHFAKIRHISARGSEHLGIVLEH